LLPEIVTSELSTEAESVGVYKAKVFLLIIKFEKEIIEKIDKYEPRVEVDDIEFEYNSEGRMIPKAYFKKREANDEED